LVLSQHFVYLRLDLVIGLGPFLDFRDKLFESLVIGLGHNALTVFTDSDFVGSGFLNDGHASGENDEGQ
jgi:hypothetical protein